jgi:DNA-binding transcriptional ArsR family regulator
LRADYRRDAHGRASDVCNEIRPPAGALARSAEISQPAASQHKRALRGAGLVLERRDGRYVNDRADPRGLALIVDWPAVYGESPRRRPEVGAA